MQVLQYYDGARMKSDMVAKGWRIVDLVVAVQTLTRAAKAGDLSFFAVARLLRGESHSHLTAKWVAEALGKTEADYRRPAAPAARAKRVPPLKRQRA